MTDISQQQQQLQKDVKTKNVTNVQDLVKTTDDTVTSKITIPILHYALDDDAVSNEIFNILITRKFDLAVIDENKKTVLFLLIDQKQYDKARRLLDTYPIQDVYTSFKYVRYYFFPCRYIMSLAAQVGYLPLLEWGKDKDADFASGTIDFAVENGHINVVEWLVKNRNAVIDMFTICKALNHNHNLIAKYLIDQVKNTLDLNHIIKKAIKYKNMEIVKYLMEHKTYLWGFDNLLKYAHTHSTDIETYIASVQLSIRQVQLQEAVKTKDINAVKTLISSVDPFKITIPILHYALGDDLESKNIFNELVTRLFNLAVLDENNKTVLFLLIKQKQHERARKILDMHAIEDVYTAFKCVRDELIFQRYIMSLAAEIGYLPLLEWGKDNKSTDFSCNTIEFAAENGHLDIVKWLHKNKTFDISSYAVYIAVRRQHNHVVKYLLENVKNTWNLHYIIQEAFEHKNMEIVTYLMEHHMSYDWNLHYVIQDAIKVKYMECVIYLLENVKNTWKYNDLINYADGYSLDIKEYIASKQLQHAVKEKNVAEVKRIIDGLCDETTSKMTIPILHYALDDDVIFNILVTRKFDLHVLDKNKEPILFLLIKQQQHARARKIFDTHSIENVYESFKYVKKNFLPCRYIMSIAAQIGYLRLLEWGKDKDADFSSGTIEYAAENGHLDIVRWLIKNNNKNFIININTICFALKNGSTDMAKCLIDTAGDNWGLNHIIKYYAIEYKNMEFIKYVMEHPKNASFEWNYTDLINYAEKYSPDIKEYLINRQSDINIPKTYFDEYATIAYNDFINGNTKTEQPDHAKKIIEMVINQNDHNNLLQLIQLPYYKHINANFVVTTAINAKNHDIIREFSKTREKTVINALLQLHE